MKILPILLGILSLPIASYAQETSTAVIVVEERNGDDPISADDPAINSLEEVDPDRLIIDEGNETIDIEANEEAIVEEIVEPIQELEEQPDDLHLPEPTEAVLVKIESPKQIEVSPEQKGGFQLITPWAPKPMQEAPAGWRYIPASPDKAYPVKVKLSSGKSLSLNVMPYTLVPTISKQVVQAREPGYQPERGYQQTFSVSARLESTTSNLKLAADSLDQTIENLSSLVDSLPK